jgi:hypothetical protein
VIRDSISAFTSVGDVVIRESISVFAVVMRQSNLVERCNNCDSKFVLLLSVVASPALPRTNPA